jgi:hypothetical protein
MRTFWVVCLLCLFAGRSEPTAAEIIARAQTWAGTVSLETTGKPWSEECSLSLLARFYQTTHRISLKRPYVNCSFFGPVQIVLSESPDHRKALVIVEAARGGDGDHSGPILEFFNLDKSALRKIDEVELFSASYIRDNQQIDSITGQMLFSFCTVCDGPEVAEPADNIFVPVQIHIRDDDLEIKTTATLTERKALWRQFQERKQAAQEEHRDEAYVASLQEQLATLLRIK